MRYGSICSGIEAATCAWHPLGWEPAFFSEIEKFPRAVLQHHYPHVPLHGDFTTLKGSEYGTIDALVAGTPCQDFSVAGLRAGITGERGNLTIEFVRVAERYLPRWLVWENVPGVLSSDGGRAFYTFLLQLAKCGYGFAYRVLDAQYFGVPQRRRRVYLVAYLGDWRIAAAVLFERESLRGNIKARKKAREGIAPTISARTKGGGGLGTDFDCDGGLIAGDSWPAQTAPTLNANFGTKQGLDNQHIQGGVDCSYPLPGGYLDEPAWALQERDYKGSDSNTKDGHLIPMAFPARLSGTAQVGDANMDMSPALGAMNPTAIAIPIRDRATRYKGGGKERNDDGSSNGFGVGEHGDPFPTLGAHDIGAIAFKPGQSAQARSMGEQVDIACTLEGAGGGNNKQAIAQAMRVRRLTPIECERLQGFPDNYTLIPWRNGTAADGPRYKAIGNSMPVPVMRWIGQRIDEVERMI